MDKIYQILISGIIMTFSNLYISSKLTNKKLNFKNYFTYLIIILMYITIVFNYMYNNQYIRILTITVLMAIFIKILYSAKTNKSIVSSLFLQLLYMIAEFIFISSISIIFKLDSNDIVNTQFGTIMANCIISILSMVLINIKYIKLFYNFLVKITNKIKSTQIILASIFVIVIANVLSAINYYKLEFGYLLIFNTLMTLSCFGIVLYSLKTKNNYIEINNKYSTTLNSLKEYEDILNKYRIFNHENKNQLLTIRNMISKDDKKTISYIDKLLKNKQKDSDKAMMKVSIIPEGGLRGLIYSKILVMEDKKINYDLFFSNSIKTVDLINKIDESMMLDICTIIGVYIDNAIDEVVKLDEKNICIEFYMDNKDLVIAVSNNYGKIIEINKLETKGYTTKSNSHGYGLPLTKEIIDDNIRLKNEKKLSKSIFTQMLKIRM